MMKGNERSFISRRSNFRFSVLHPFTAHPARVLSGTFSDGVGPLSRPASIAFCSYFWKYDESFWLA